jgi:two-component system, chemotaxis family, CheB/CheR fusion protein
MSNESPKKELVSSAKLFLVVGIGASAGGLEAFKQLIKAIPVDSGIAYILFQHLDPSHESILCELLQKTTLIPVHEITDNIQVEPDHIYVVPPNKLLTATDGILKLTQRPPKGYGHFSIDHFFNSLADIHQSQAIGVVLSGTGKDGTQGLRSIKERGGITFAQHHHSAGFNEMPQNAINAGVVDFVLPPEGIVHQLLELGAILKDNTGSEKVRETKPEDIYFKQILGILDLQKGVDFTYYKQNTIRRRITRRMVLRNMAKLRDYMEYLKESPAEVATLFQDILIPVTEFFRDTHAFENLCKISFPALLKAKNPNDSFRVWSVGCSSGQEAYSIAICLFEFFSTQPEHCKLQVFATDLSDVAIAHARSGFYSATEVAMISPERLVRFFNRTDGGYQVNKTIRDMCVFATHNVLTNPPFAGIDLIACRNVLIYMDPFLQRKAMATFHYSLNEKGMLFLGKSESLGNSSDLFSPFNEADKIYSRNAVPGRFIQIAAKRRLEFIASGNSDGKVLKDNRPNDDFQKRADEIILSQAPAGVIVNEHFEILQFRGTTGDWLESAPGKPSVNVLKMAKNGLMVDLRNMLHKAKTDRRSVIKEGIVLEGGNAKKIVTIEITPITNTISVYYLIQFRNTGVVAITKDSKGTRGKEKMHPQETRALQLEKELSQTREDMRTIAEDQEADNEELLSANEELLSGSEELRSLNEELEISKEELQSTVEELSVSNQELSFRNDELTYSRKYAEAIITTISEPLVVLNKNLEITSANAAFYKSFNLEEKEILKQAFYEIDGGQWNVAELRKMLEQTLDENNFNTHYELKKEFKRTGNRVMLLNARKIINDSNSEQLILLAIEDITDRKNLEESMQTKAEFARKVLDSSPIITSTASADGRITYSNKFFLDYSGLNLEQSISLGWAAVVHPDQIKDVTAAWTRCIQDGAEFYKEILIKKHDGTYRWHIIHALPIRDLDGVIISWVCSASDIHDRKMFSNELERQIRERTQSLKDSNTELMHSNKNLEQFAFIASHDLQEPLRKIKTFASMLSENYMNNLSGEGRNLVIKISAASDRLSTLIQDVLNFSSIESSQNAFVMTDLNNILTNVIGDFALALEEKKAVVKKDVLPAIEAIPVQINQLFYNLLSNSIKFSQVVDLPLITITSRKLAKVEIMKYPELKAELDYFEILFADNGIGFDDQYKEKIFEIFQRLHSREGYTGTGIGLALCRKIIHNHGGIIFVESHQNTGTLFHIILPLNAHRSKFDLLPGYVE